MNQDSLEKNRWWIAVAAVVMQLCLGTVYAWSIFKKPMIATHGWGETETQVAFMIYAAMFAVSVALGGVLVDRKGPRFVGTIGGILFGTGLLLAGLANTSANVWLLYIAYGIIAGLGGGFGYVTPITTLIRWFPDKRGLVTGLAVMGYGFGSFILGNAGPSLIMKIGIAHTFFWWGAISFCLIMGAVTVLKNPPGKWTPSGMTQPENDLHTIQGSFTFDQAVKTPQMWILWLMLLMTISAGLGLISQLSPMAQDVMIKAAAGALDEEMMKGIVIASGGVVAIAAIFNGLGRLFWAWISDRTGRKAIFAALFLTQAAGYILLAHTVNVMLFTAVSCCLLACYGGSLASMPAFVADEFGPEHIGKIYGTIFTACALAGIVGPYVFASAKEITGSFITGLYIISALSAAGFVLSITFRKPRMEMRDH